MGTTLKQYNIEYGILKFNTAEDYKLGAKLIRGFCLRMFGQEHIEFHNHFHKKGEDVIPGFPVIQYRYDTILGLKHGKDILKSIYEEIPYFMPKTNRHREVKLESVDFEIKEDVIGVTDEMIRYRFENYMALNPKNYETYMSLEGEKQYKFLNNLLKIHVSSLFAGLELKGVSPKYFKIRGSFKERTEVKYKKRDTILFSGNFETNLILPDNLGIGNQISKGYGQIRRVNIEE